MGLCSHQSYFNWVDDLAKKALHATQILNSPTCVMDICFVWRQFHWHPSKSYPQRLNHLLSSSISAAICTNKNRVCKKVHDFCTQLKGIGKVRKKKKKKILALKPKSATSFLIMHNMYYMHTTHHMHHSSSTIQNQKDKGIIYIHMPT